MKVEELRTWWVAEFHPDGAFDVAPLMQSLERNYRACMEGHEKGWVLVGLFPTMEAAREGLRKVKRERRERREAAEVLKSFEQKETKENEGGGG